MEAAILNEGLDVGDLLKIFSRSVTDRAEEGEDAYGDNNDGDDQKKRRR